ncbi:glycosyl hydrolase 115 family protein [Flavisolibacter sp. BT320]|nr:glycosyl hydrolase 115 family protein [Flavisolibacter longurius]
MKRFFGLFVLLCTQQIFAQNITSTKKLAGSFTLFSPASAPTIVYDAADDSLVRIASYLLQQDVASVSGKTLPVATKLGLAKNIILIGNLQKSRFIQQLVAEKKLSVTDIQNKWEGYRIQVVNAPFKGVAQALVIVGSDRRGAAYGTFELSQQMGVSPWHWWADVPAKKANQLYVQPRAVLVDSPRVKYRGIFINDEAPALSNWSRSTFGGFNHNFYEKVFELILRLKGNYLWPAMWGNAFYDDDPQNRQAADNYGVVIGTSHHEPLMRAHDEWRRHGKGKWNYDSNAVALQQFWKDGMQRATNEKIVSVGMRGDGDEPMSRETATALLERIVTDQRQIIADVTGKPATETPQLWALYKEVQDYYDKGMRVPDDVTLLLADDNWGNIRRLPKLTDPKRSGGHGIYYHFDYVGGPRNYKWLNTNNLSRVWEQMHLAWRHGVDRIWIVNVGDIKPMELPTSFFLDYAWNPEKWNEDNLRSYYTAWAEKQFGKPQSKAIGDLLRLYAQISARIKPELLDQKTYSIQHYNEADRVLKEWQDLHASAEKINTALPAAYRDAYFQLVLHPIKALANLHEMYWNIAYNHAHAKDSSLSANAYADAAEQLYVKDSLISLEYHQLGGGKWNHMMSQTHIGYTYWQQPPFNKMPAVARVQDGVAFDTTVAPPTLAPPALQRVPKTVTGNVFYEKDSLVAMEAEHWTRAVNAAGIKWKVIPDIGKTGSGISTFPVTTATRLSAPSPRVDYDFYTSSTGKAEVNLYFSPTLNFHNEEEGLQVAVSINDSEPQVVSLNKEDKNSISGIWNTWVANNIIIKKASFPLQKTGRHTLKYWMISPGVVLQKIVVDLGGLKPSYLGPQETLLNSKK